MNELYLLQEQIAILSATLNSISDGIIVLNHDNRIININQKFLDIWHVKEEELLSSSFTSFLDFISKKIYEPELYTNKLNIINNGNSSLLHEYLKLKDGRILELYSQPKRYQLNVIGRVWCFREITEQIKTKEDLIYQVYHDDLTGLYNRTYFLEKLESLLYESKISQKTELFAVVFLDIDRFKTINDELGHTNGDILITRVARRLKYIFKESCIVARLGGDEFTIIMENLQSTEECTEKLAVLLEHFQSPFYTSQQQVYLSISIGVAFSSVGYKSLEDLIKYADTAMYDAKFRGGNSYKVFDFSMFESAFEKVQLEVDLRKAIKEDQFELFLQPIVSAQTREIVGYESLLRWKHPVKGFIPPDKFIPLAEETGLIVSIGEWVIKKSIFISEIFRQKNISRYISINLSLHQLRQKNLYKVVENLVHKHGVIPSHLCFEITESSIMDNPLEGMKILYKFKRMGIKLSIDDFGVGYSSFNYLKKFPVDILKIDKSFIDDIPKDKNNIEIVKAIISIAHSLKLRITAEGIENQEQFDTLKELDCDNIQGYLVSRPVPYLQILEDKL